MLDAAVPALHVSQETSDLHAQHFGVLCLMLGDKAGPLVAKADEDDHHCNSNLAT